MIIEGAPLVAGEGVGVAGVCWSGGSLGHVGARVGGRGTGVGGREGAGAAGQGMVKPV